MWEFEVSLGRDDMVYQFTHETDLQSWNDALESLRGRIRDMTRCQGITYAVRTDTNEGVIYLELPDYDAEISIGSFQGEQVFDMDLDGFSSAPAA